MLSWIVQHSDVLSLGLAIGLGAWLSAYLIWEALQGPESTTGRRTTGSLSLQELEDSLKKILAYGAPEGQGLHRTPVPEAQKPETLQSVSEAIPRFQELESEIQHLRQRLSECESNNIDQQEYLKLKEKLEKYEIIAEDIHLNFRLKAENYFLKQWIQLKFGNVLEADPAWIHFQKNPQAYQRAESIDQLLKNPPEVTVEAPNSLEPEMASHSNLSEPQTEINLDQTIELFQQQIQKSHELAQDDNIDLLKNFNPDQDSQKESA